MSYYQDPASTGGVYAFIIEYSSTRSHWSNWAKSHCNKYKNIRTKTFRCICTGLKQTVILSQPINQYRSYRNISARKFWYICTWLKQTLFLFQPFNKYRKSIITRNFWLICTRPK